MPELLGCVANGKTTDEAVSATPDAIRAYLRYLKRHGEKVDANETIGTRVAEHNTEGLFSGQAIFPPDLRPLAPSDLARYLRWLEWSREDLLALVKGIDDRRLRAKPPKGRSLHDILLHVLAADKGYVAERGELDLRVALAEARRAALTRLAALTPAERKRVRRTGQSTYSAFRVIRRMLEHEWEHRREIAARAGREA